MDGYTRLPISQFAAWLATKPREETFHFYDTTNCALAQFVQHLHPEALYVGGGVTIAHAANHLYDFDTSLDQAFATINRKFPDLEGRSGNERPEDYDLSTFGELYDEVIKLV